MRLASISESFLKIIQRVATDEFISRAGEENMAFI